MKYMQTLVMVCFMLLSAGASASWKLNTQHAQINFVSIKNNSIGEVHHFDDISGRIDDVGNVQITVALDSVKTGIDIRDERIRDLLFSINDYPQATLVAKIDGSVLTALKVGEAQVQHFDLTVNLHGQKQVLKVEAGLVKTLSGAIHVESLSPILLDASQFQLLAGIAKLQELAGLQAIASVVPVTFALVFMPE